jgi:hypothetical protein
MALGMRIVVLHEPVENSVGGELRISVRLREEAPIIVERFRLNQDHIGDLQPSESKRHLEQNLGVVSDHETNGSMVAMKVSDDGSSANNAVLETLDPLHSHPIQ